METFIARYEENGIRKSVLFDKVLFNQEKAEGWLKNNGIQNFFFFFEPNEPRPIGKNGILFKGEVGFDITMDILMPYILEGKDIVLDTFGGDLWESLKIYDTIQGLDMNPSIGVLGTCASAGMQILLSTNNRWITPNSRGLIHNPWIFVAGDDEIFRKTTKQLEEDKMNIAQIYSDISGKTLDEILSLMKEERILNSSEMQKLNFAKIKKWNNKENSKPSINNENMTEKESKQLSGIENMLNGISDTIKNLFSTSKNLVIQDVNGVELDFGDEVETREQISVGNTATADGEPANGDYVLSDGTTLVFENGTLMEINEPEMDDEENENEATDNTVEELQEEVNSLKDVNSDLHNKLADSNAIIAELQSDNEKIKNMLTSELEKLAKEFNDFKNQYSGEMPEVNTPGADNSEGANKNKFSYKPKKR